MISTCLPMARSSATFKAAASPVGTPWMWTLAFGHHQDRTPTHGYQAIREAAMAASAKSWRRNNPSRRRSVMDKNPPAAPPETACPQRTVFITLAA
jgi:hypothetical protein